MKKVILIAALIALAPFGCKTHKAVQSSRQETKAVNLDSSWLKSDSVSVDTSKKQVQVQKESQTVEEYSESNIIIRADKPKTIEVPGSLELDSTSTLDSVKFSNDRYPKSSLKLYRGDKGNAVAEVVTPNGKQVFKNFSSIEINSKKYKKTTTGKSDSTSNELINKILKNSIDSGHKSVDSTSKVQVKQVVVKDSKTQFWSLLAGFWWIPVSLGVLLLIIWKWPNILNFFKRK